MQTVERTRWLPYSSAQIYHVLTDVEKFAQIVKRIIALDVLERNGDVGRILATIDLPGGKTIQAEGRVSGSNNEKLAFETDKPFPLAINWQLSPAEQDGSPGTTVSYTVAVDLSAKVAFLSKIVLNGYLSTELEGDLDRLEQFLQDEDANG
jgi:ribosome-associated toxin RatA of RatAB toxin-antitoxin module